MSQRIRVLIVAAFSVASRAEATGAQPAALTSCDARSVLQRVADAQWLRDSLERFDTRIAAVLPNAKRTMLRADIGSGDYAAAMRSVRQAAESAFAAAGIEKLPAGFRETFVANANAAADVLARLNGATAAERPHLLLSLDAGRFDATPEPMAGGFTTVFFAVPARPEGFRVDPVALASPTFHAACWSLISADLVLRAFTAPLVEETASRIAAIQQEWKNFDDYRRPETALEFALNHLRWKQSLNLHPPKRQLVFLHPVAAVVANGLGKSSERRPAYGLEVLGGIWYPGAWKWKHYVGFSVIAVGTQTGPARVGGYIHASRYGSAGIVRTVAGPSRLAFVTSIDLARFIWKDDKALAEFAAAQQTKAKGQITLGQAIEDKKAQ